MRLSRLLPSVIASSLFATASFAQWETVQSDGQARAVYRNGGYELWVHCRRGQGFELRLTELTAGGTNLGDVTSLMMWVRVPDGRTDRWPVFPVVIDRAGARISGKLVVSDFNLEFFRNADSFRLDSPGTRQVFLEGDMRGTGAARLAFLEQCGL